MESCLDYITGPGCRTVGIVYHWWGENPNNQFMNTKNSGGMYVKMLIVVISGKRVNGAFVF